MSDSSRNEQFYVESREQLEDVERYLLAMEQSQSLNLEDINNIFRCIHTIKGGADFLGLTNLKDLTHATEDVLDLVRKQHITLTFDGLNTLISVTDTLKEMLSDPDLSESIDISRLVDEIQKLIPAEESHEEVQDFGPTADDELDFGTPAYAQLFTLKKSEVDSYRKDNFSFYILELKSKAESDESVDLEKILNDLVSIGYLIDSKTSLVDTGQGPEEMIHIFYRSVLTRTTSIRYLNLDPRDLFEIKDIYEIDTDTEAEAVDSDQDKVVDRRLERRQDRRRTNDRRSSQGDRRDSGLAYVSDDAEVVEQRSPQYAGLSSGDTKSTGSQSIRVNVEILDDLMNLVGELVLTRNQLNQNVEAAEISNLNLTAQRLDIVTSELQESIMSTRMQPLGTILSKFHRIIRDMSNQLGKSVKLVLEGEDVELDKSIIENISDPLTHLVRNAIDHGIEQPDVRHSSDKPLNATLSISAKQEGGHVVIEISDDGRGIDTDKIKNKAIDLGLVDKAKVDDLPEKEILKFIFTPGFSTAEVVSDISGRGVGLDVVFTNINKLGGTIDVETNKGEGTTFKVSLPLTLAIVPSLLVESGGDVFAIPQINLAELVRIPPDQISERIETLGDSSVVRLRDKLLPIVWLDKVLGLDTSNVQTDGSINIAVVSAGEFYYGIVVDGFTDSEEIVVKPLGKHLRECKSYASATILGDGRAALILDVNGISDFVSMSAQNDIEEREKKLSEDEKLQKANENIGKERSLLIVENAENEYFGVDLAYVNRIERIREEQIETMARKHVIKYRGGILRVFKLDEAIDTQMNESEDGFVYLIVFYMLGTEVAIMVSNIVDIIDTRLEIDESIFHGQGIVGSAIILDQITLIVDLFEMVKFIDPALVGKDSSDIKQTKELSHTVEDIAHDDVPTILIVEDSTFFQDKLKALVSDMHLNFILAENGQEGWDLLNENAGVVDLILMDIEMPMMTGLELTRLIRSDDCYTDIPIIMLTSLARKEDVQKGMDAGASEYLIKMDQELVRRKIYKYIPEDSGSKKNQSDNGGVNDDV